MVFFCEEGSHSEAVTCNAEVNAVCHPSGVKACGSFWHERPGLCVATENPNLTHILASINDAYQGAGEEKVRKVQETQKIYSR